MKLRNLNVCLKRLSLRWLALAAVICLTVGNAFGDTSPPRYALVIGNGEYKNLGHLKNPVNDATDVSRALQDLGFQVDLLTNSDLPSMEKAVVRLGNRLAEAVDSIGFFYYAGHGVQSNGMNFFIPVDATIAGEAFLKTKSLAAQEVLDTLQDARNGLNIVVLDACRDNPFSWVRSGTRGLAVVGVQPQGSIVVYATSAGRTAQDGLGRNGTFTAELLKNLRTPGLEVKEVFNRTGAGVNKATSGAQVPAVYSQFFDDVYLAGAPVKETLQQSALREGATDAQFSKASPELAREELSDNDSIPRASIRIDGNFNDWKDVLPAFDQKSTREGNLIYDKVFLAADSEKIYIRLDIRDFTPASFFHPNNFDTRHNSMYGVNITANGDRDVNLQLVFNTSPQSNRWLIEIDERVMRQPDSVDRSVGPYAMKGRSLEAAFPLESIRRYLRTALSTTYTICAWSGYLDSNWRWVKDSGDSTALKRLTF